MGCGGRIVVVLVVLVVVFVVTVVVSRCRTRARRPQSAGLEGSRPFPQLLQHNCKNMIANNDRKKKIAKIPQIIQETHIQR